jgi:hypothetical protein
LAGQDLCLLTWWDSERGLKSRIFLAHCAGRRRCLTSGPHIATSPAGLYGERVGALTGGHTLISKGFVHVLASVLLSPISWVQWCQAELSSLRLSPDVQ